MSEHLPRQDHGTELETTGKTAVEVTLVVPVTAEDSVRAKATADMTAEVMHRLTGLEYTVTAGRPSYGVYCVIYKDNLYLLPEAGVTLEALIEQLKHQASGVKNAIRYMAAQARKSADALVSSATAGMGLETLEVMTTDDGEGASELAGAIGRAYGVKADVETVDSFNYRVIIRSAQEVSFAGLAIIKAYAQGYLDGYLDGEGAGASSADAMVNGPDYDDGEDNL